MTDTRPVSCPDDYDYVFREYRRFLNSVVSHSGIPSALVEEASGEILVRMMTKDGLATFDGDIRNNPNHIKAYLASYFSLGARAELSRIISRRSRASTLSTEVIDTHFPAAQPEDENGPCPDTDLMDHLLAITTGDAQHFIRTAAEYPTYPKTRERLVEEGWDTLRIRAAVRDARGVVRRFLASTECSPES